MEFRNPKYIRKSLLQLKKLALWRFEPTVQPMADSGMSFKCSDLKFIRLKLFVLLFQQIESLNSPKPRAAMPPTEGAPTRQNLTL